MPQWILDVTKAIAGGATAGLTAAATALVGDHHVDAAEWIAIALATVTGAYAVWQTPDAMSPLRRALKNSRTKPARVYRPPTT